MVSGFGLTRVSEHGQWTEHDYTAFQVCSAKRSPQNCTCTGSISACENNFNKGQWILILCIWNSSRMGSTFWTMDLNTVYGQRAWVSELGLTMVSELGSVNWAWLWSVSMASELAWLWSVSLGQWTGPDYGQWAWPVNWAWLWSVSLGQWTGLWSVSLGQWTGPAVNSW